MYRLDWWSMMFNTAFPFWLSHAPRREPSRQCHTKMTRCHLFSCLPLETMCHLSRPRPEGGQNTRHVGPQNGMKQDTFTSWQLAITGLLIVCLYVLVCVCVCVCACAYLHSTDCPMLTAHELQITAISGHISPYNVCVKIHQTTLQHTDKHRQTDTHTHKRTHRVPQSHLLDGLCLYQVDNIVIWQLKICSRISSGTLYTARLAML